MDSQAQRNTVPEQRALTSKEIASHQDAQEPLLPAVCVGSNDNVWAGLLAQNLSARGIVAKRCDLRSLGSHIASAPCGSWIVLDGGWPMLELQDAVEALNPLLRQPHVNTVMVVDELVGPHPLSALEPDTFISRNSDMRVFVRQLLLLFRSFNPLRPPALKSEPRLPLGQES